MPTIVAGGSGFVGLNLTQHLLAEEETVVNLSLVPPPAAAQRLFSSLPGTLHNMNSSPLYPSIQRC